MNISYQIKAVVTNPAFRAGAAVALRLAADVVDPVTVKPVIR